MGTCTNGGLLGILCKIGGLFDAVIPVLVALGVVYLVWGIVRYVIGDSEEAKKRGKDGIIYGIIGLAVIIGVWGLVNIVLTTFDLKVSAPTNGDLQNLLPRSNSSSTPSTLYDMPGGTLN